MYWVKERGDNCRKRKTAKQNSLNGLSLLVCRLKVHICAFLKYTIYDFWTIDLFAFVSLARQIKESFVSHNISAGLGFWYDFTGIKSQSFIEK